MESTYSTPPAAAAQMGQELPLLGEDKLPLVSSLVVKENDPSKVEVGSRPQLPEPYQPDRDQALVEGRKGLLRQLDFQARLEKVEFGQIQGHAACLIVISTDFTKGLYLSEKERFISAKVIAEFTAVGNPPTNREVFVHDFYPGVNLGHIQTRPTSSTLQLQFPDTVFGGGGPSYTTSSSQAIQAQHIIHGRKVGKSGNVVEWGLNENATSRSGLYLGLKFAVTVKYTTGNDFQLKVDIRPTTSFMTPTVQKKRYPIIFSPKIPEATSSNAEAVHMTSGIRAGSLSVPGERWVPSAASSTLANLSLSRDEFESLTGVGTAILGPQGPGAGPPTSTAASPGT